jgi:diaminopimelate epimerase
MIEFVKMHGLGNDFMVINAVEQPVDLTPLQIQKLANRRLGVGFDQLLVIESPSSSEADFYCRIFNADGSSAEQCGNGVRCVGRLILDEKLCSESSSIRLQTDGGLVVLEGMENGDIRVNMGAPEFEPSAIPVQLEKDKPCHSHVFSGREVSFSVVNMGNPHAIIQVEQLNEQDVTTLGQLLGSSPVFPEGVNVGFSHIVSPQNMLLQVYERGAGETMACGSGACAAMVAGRRLGYLQERVRIEQPGGSLVIEWQGPGQPVWMTGPATTTFKGISSLELIS